MNNLGKKIREQEPASTGAFQPSVKPMPFFYYAGRDAKTVSVIGEFNHWNRFVHPMRRRQDGWWYAEVPLAPGDHRYVFLVNGAPQLDPRARENVVNNHFPKASVITVN